MVDSLGRRQLLPKVTAKSNALVLAGAFVLEGANRDAQPCEDAVACWSGCSYFLGDLSVANTYRYSPSAIQPLGPNYTAPRGEPTRD